MHKILYIAPQSPYPSYDGGKISLAGALESLNSFSRVYFAFGRKDGDVIDSEKLSQACFKSIHLDVDPKDTIFTVLKSLFTFEPFKMIKYYKQKNLKRLLDITREEKIDLIVVSHPHMAKYALKLKEMLGVPFIIREHNAEYELIEQYIELERNLIKKLIGKWQLSLMKPYQENIWSKAEKILCISDNDERKIAMDTSGKFSNKLTKLYDGVHIPSESLVMRKFEPLSFIYTASLKTLQNKYNLNLFIENIWVEFNRLNPEAKLYVTGNTDKVFYEHLHLSKVQAEALNIINLGFVDDLTSVILKKQFFLSPTYMGSGMRIKVLEAAALGMPIVTTDIDYNSLPFFDDMQNIVLANNCEQFSSKIMFLTNNSEALGGIERNVYKLAKETLIWDSYRRQMEVFINDVLQNYKSGFIV